MRFHHFRGVACTAALGVAFMAACGDPFGLGRAGFDNVVDTVTLFALSGTPVNTESAYTLQFPAQAVRTDLSASFDFAFDIDADARPLVLSTGALRLGRGSGLIKSGETFDALTLAPDGGYDFDVPLEVAPDDVVLIRSRSLLCDSGINSAYFAKLHVIDIDAGARSMSFEILVNQNCGFRGLELGRPTR